MKDAAPVVLVVEDEWLTRHDLAQELQRAGWTVLEAATGDDALACLRNRMAIHALITDIQLGGSVSGWDVADDFRAADPDIPVIYVSGNRHEKSRMVAGSLFFDKPYSTAELSAACGRLGRLGDPAAPPVTS